MTRTQRAANMLVPVGLAIAMAAATNPSWKSLQRVVGAALSTSTSGQVVWMQFQDAGLYGAVAHEIQLPLLLSPRVQDSLALTSEDRRKISRISHALRRDAARKVRELKQFRDRMGMVTPEGGPLESSLVNQAKQELRRDYTEALGEVLDVAQQQRLKTYTL